LLDCDCDGGVVGGDVGTVDTIGTVGNVGTVGFALVLSVLGVFGLGRTFLGVDDELGDNVEPELSVTMNNE
jgi:hypothetical protein